jgi:hypothetical protein
MPWISRTRLTGLHARIEELTGLLGEAQRDAVGFEAAAIRTAGRNLLLTKQLREARTGAAHLLAEQLLDATSGRNPAARAALGLAPETPWLQAEAALNALTDAGVAFRINTENYAVPTIVAPDGPERIEWDLPDGPWRYVDGADKRVTL